MNEKERELIKHMNTTWEGWNRQSWEDRDRQCCLLLAFYHEVLLWLWV